MPIFCEWELYDLLLTSGLNISHTNREILDGKEIDIYFPDYKFGIEYNGKHWHNEEDDAAKRRMCEERGIYLITVDDYEFNCDREPTLVRIKTIFKEKYNVDLQIYPEKVKEVIRTSDKCRKIICTDTMEIFDSYLHAEKKFGFPAGEIVSVCNGNAKNTHGYHFQYYSQDKQYEKTEVKYEYKRKRVKCIETGEVFESVTKINELISISASLSGKQKTTAGMHWEHTDDPATDTTMTEEMVEAFLKTYTRKKAVICLTDGKTFESSTDAAEYYKIPEDGISDCCRGTAGSTYGKQFQYVDEPHEFVPKEIPYKKIHCVDLCITFNNVNEAVEYFHAPNKEVIRRVCRGERKTYKKHVFKYVD